MVLAVRREDRPGRPPVAGREQGGWPGRQARGRVDGQAPDRRRRRQLAPGDLSSVGREARASRNVGVERRGGFGGARHGPPAVAERKAVEGVAPLLVLRAEPEGLPVGRDARLVEPRAGVEPHEVGPVGLDRPDLRLREARLGGDEVEAAAVGRPGGGAVPAPRVPGGRHAERRPAVGADDPDRRRRQARRRGGGDVGEGRRLERDPLAVGREGGARPEGREEPRLSAGGRNDPEAAAVLGVERDELAVGGPGRLDVVLAVPRQGAAGASRERPDVDLELPVRHDRRGELVSRAARAPGRARGRWRFRGASACRRAEGRAGKGGRRIRPSRGRSRRREPEGKAPILPEEAAQFFISVPGGS